MKLKTWIASASAALLLFGTAAQADDDRPAHFKGEVVSSWSQAHEVLNQYNQELASLLAQDTLTPQDGAKVHQLTYSLENALEYMENTIEELAVQLEEVHLASEKNISEAMKSTGAIYLDNVKVLQSK